jgi:hypothetical protein
MKKTMLFQAALIGFLCASSALAQTQPTTAPTAQPTMQPMAQSANQSNLLFVVQPGLSAAQYEAQSKAYAAQARILYPDAYVDLPYWNQAVAYAEAAVQAEPSNITYVRNLAMMYETTKWWSRAMTQFDRLDSLGALDAESRRMAAYTARKLGVLALGRRDGVAASVYLRRSLALEQSATTRKLLERVNLTFGL